MRVLLRPSKFWLIRSLCVALLLVCGRAAIAGAQAAHRPDAATRYAEVLRSLNSNFTPKASQEMAEHVLFISTYYDVDPAFVVAIVNQESGWHTKAVSPVGALGLGQLMPGTARGLDVIPTDALENLDGTVRYIKRQLTSFGSVRPRAQRYRLALAAYNAGPGAVQKYGGIPPYKETIAYVSSIMASWERLKRVLPATDDSDQNVVKIAARRLHVDLGSARPSDTPRLAARLATIAPPPPPPLLLDPLPHSSAHQAAHQPMHAPTNIPAKNTPVAAPHSGAFDIAAFTGETRDSACGPGNLLNESSSCGWNAEKERDVRIGMVLDLSKSPRMIQAVVVRFDANATPIGLEVATSDDPRANADDWIGIRYCRMPQGSHEITCTLGERTPRAMRLIVDGSRADIRAIHFLPE